MLGTMCMLPWDACRPVAGSGELLQLLIAPLTATATPAPAPVLYISFALICAVLWTSHFFCVQGVARQAGGALLPSCAHKCTFGHAKRAVLCRICREGAHALESSAAIVAMDVKGPPCMRRARRGLQSTVRSHPGCSRMQEGRDSSCRSSTCFPPRRSFGAPPGPPALVSQQQQQHGNRRTRLGPIRWHRLRPHDTHAMRPQPESLSVPPSRPRIPAVFTAVFRLPPSVFTA